MDSDTSLQNECVSLTGRGLSFTRSLGIKLIEQHGGSYAREVSPQTTLLVIGAAGWPLQKNGRLTRNLQYAISLSKQGYNIKIETEEEFLQRIAYDQDGAYYTLPQLARLLKLSPQRLSVWKSTGLLPSTTKNGVDYFDFPTVVRCRTLATLATSRAGSRRLRRSLRVLRRHFESVDTFFDNMIELGSHLATRNADGRLIEPNGQQNFDFESDQGPEHPQIISHIQYPHSDDQKFEQAVALESEGQLEQAQSLYLELLEADPADSDVLFNLGNVLTSQGLYAESLPYYRKAVVHDRSFPEAWNNLGNSLLETQQLEDARFAFQQAMRLAPSFSSPIYGLALTLEAQGQRVQARQYWRQFLQFEANGQYAQYAFERLQSTSSRK